MEPSVNPLQQSKNFDFNAQRNYEPSMLYQDQTTGHTWGISMNGLSDRKYLADKERKLGAKESDRNQDNTEFSNQIMLTTDITHRTHDIQQTGQIKQKPKSSGRIGLQSESYRDCYNGYTKDIPVPQQLMTTPQE